MKPKSNLSNCYTPQAQTEAIFHVRADGRSPEDLRKFGLETNFRSSTVAGSCLVEIGKTKVFCSVIGPTATNLPPSIELDIDRGAFCVEVSYFGTAAYPETKIRNKAALSLEPQSKAQWNRVVSQEIQRKETDLSEQMKNILDKVVPLRNYPKTAMILEVQVLQDDGGVLTASSIAATLALLDAGFELYDMVVACSVAVTREDGICWTDPTADEIQTNCAAIYTLVWMPNWKDVVLWEQKGAALTDTTNNAFAICREGCRKWHKQLRNHLLLQQNR